VDRDRQRLAPSLVGIILIVVGVIFLVQPVLGVNLMHVAWPLFIIVPGLLMLAAAVGGNRGASGMAVPGAIVTMTGAILFVQNAFDLWSTWAYAWALVAPTSVGLGLWLRGALTVNPRTERAGRRLVQIGLVLFLAFGAFFEVVLNWGRLANSTLGVAAAVVLIAAGLAMALRRPDPR
jgi:hypothetical protein